MSFDQGHEPNWRPPPKERILKRMESITMQSYRPKIISDNRRKIEDLCRDLVVNNDHIHVVEQRIRAAINKGLSKEGHERASVKCYPTYVRYLPTGFERGKFLALDLGGTNFRVLVVDIGENKEFHMQSKIFAIPRAIMVGSSEDLFDHIADCLHIFVLEHELQEQKLPLGFTFSFPCKQEGLAKVSSCSAQMPSREISLDNLDRSSRAVSPTGPRGSSAREWRARTSWTC